ncbi:CBS domain-containing protein [Myxococcota bacterium]|nr:CBS domain-containing protein [Myxococcota bacterium]
MSQAKPTIGQYMTPAAHFVAPSDSLVTAQSLMEAHVIRHLPVVDAGKVVGMVTMSDLYVMESTFAFDPEKTEVSSAMSAEVYTVEPGELLETVAAEMADRRIGSAVIIEGGELRGVFTTTDACRVLAEVLKAR